MHVPPTDNPPTFHLNNHPLLKIESVVPTVGVHNSLRHSRLIRRSHSTLSSAYLRKVTDSRSRTVAPPVNRCNGATEDGANGSDEPEKTANKFPRIKRTKKDREKFPDRINLDRKGLTAIPVIEDEAQLRLLSLQHNLINIFHVPELTVGQQDDDNNAEKQSSEPPPSSDGICQHSQQGLTNMAALAKLSHRPNYSYGSLYNARYRLGLVSPLTPGTLPASLVSTSIHSTPSILINGVPNYSSRSLANGKSLQLLNVNPKLILKKHQYTPSLVYQSPVLSSYTFNHYQKQISPTGKSVSDSGIYSATTNVSVNSPPINGGSDPPFTSKLIETVPYGDTLQNLVFLDLYDNQIEKIDSLDGLKSLTVLLLGKNRIVDITGIISLRNSLRVLDLHGNRVTNISHKICRLQELKSLNLAGNALRQIQSGDFAGLQNLRELNLKRNRIKRLNGFEDLQHLERLWLCNNDIQRVEDMSCIAKAINLKEVTVENNPVSLAGDCCSFLVSYLPNLVLLSQMHVTDQVKRAAMAWRKSKEASDLNFVSLSSDVGQSIRREEIISNARTNWELLRSQPHTVLSYTKPKQQARERELEVVTPSLLPPTSPQATPPSPKPIPKLEKETLSSDSQESHESLKDVPEKGTGPTSASSTSTVDVDYFRLPPILGLDSLAPVVKTENVSVEDSMGANADSTSIFSGASSGSTSSSRSPSSCRSSGPGSSACGELDDRETEFQDRQSRVTLDKNIAVDEEEDTARVEFPVARVVEPSKDVVKGTDLKMPTIRISENESPADTRSNISISSSLRAEHSASIPVDESATQVGNSVRSIRNRCTTSKKILPPTTAQQQNLSAHRAHTAKLSPSAALLVVNNNNNNNNSTNTNNNPSKGNSPGNGSGNGGNALQQVGGATNKTHVVDREREQGGDYLIEICGRYLNVYGVGALRFVDKQWNVQKAGDVHTVKFSYINFNNISGILGKIKSRFPNAEHFVFRETNITCLGQLNSLAEIQGLQSLVLEPEGNLICTKKWRSYAIFRLSHWGLKQINGQDISEVETEEADRLYGHLPDLVLWSLPESLLAPLLSRLRLEEPCQASRLSAKDWLMQAEPSLKCVVGKEALQWRKSPTGNCNNTLDEPTVRAKGKQCFSTMMENTCNAVEKLDQLETLWPTMLTEMIRNTLIDYSQLDTYVKNLQKSLP